MRPTKKNKKNDWAKNRHQRSSRAPTVGWSGGEHERYNAVGLLASVTTGRQFTCSTSGIVSRCVCASHVITTTVAVGTIHATAATTPARPSHCVRATAGSNAAIYKITVPLNYAGVCELNILARRAHAVYSIKCPVDVVICIRPHGGLLA